MLKSANARRRAESGQPASRGPIDQRAAGPSPAGDAGQHPSAMPGAPIQSHAFWPGGFPVRPARRRKALSCPKSPSSTTAPSRPARRCATGERSNGSLDGKSWTTALRRRFPDRADAKRILDGLTLSPQTQSGHAARRATQHPPDAQGGEPHGMALPSHCMWTRFKGRSQRKRRGLSYGQ